ncbi:hypothetical protein DENSPDRAFT_853351 [Dentipellis sp. KUC8613]|nr:hypothetical protein DENSPDRAFT_853351 [Dentipellis sp. KUC8613]
MREKYPPATSRRSSPSPRQPPRRSRQPLRLSRQLPQPKQNYKGYTFFEVRLNRSDEPHLKIGYEKAVECGYFGNSKLLLDWPASNNRTKTATFIESEDWDGSQFNADSDDDYHSDDDYSSDDDMGGPRIHSAFPWPPTAISSQNATMRPLPQASTDGSASMGVDARGSDRDTFSATMGPQTRPSNIEVGRRYRETYRRDDCRRQRMGKSSSQRLDHLSSSPIRASSSRRWSPEASHRRLRLPRSHSQSRDPESHHRPWNRSRSRSPPTRGKRAVD